MAINYTNDIEALQSTIIKSIRELATADDAIIRYLVLEALEEISLELDDTINQFK